MGFFIFIKDLFTYPFTKKKSISKFDYVLGFLFRDYPAYLWTKPSLLRILAFPLLFIYVLFGVQKIDQITSNSTKKSGER